MAIIGYARVSTNDQNTALQQDALRKHGCERIFEDHLSGASNSRPGLIGLLEFIRPGDIVCVWRLDRLGRSLPELIQIVTQLECQQVSFCSLTEKIDTSTPGGQLIFHIFGALAQFEREIIRERVNAGLTAARKRGKIGGRPRALDNDRHAAFSTLVNQGLSQKEICASLNISRATYYRYQSGVKKADDV